jgi:hypothetical protein
MTPHNPILEFIRLDGLSVLDYLQCCDMIYGVNGKRQCTPEMNAVSHTPARYMRADRRGN